MVLNFEPPQFKKDAYNCPHCSAYSKQIWHEIEFNDPYRERRGNATGILAYLCICRRCAKVQVWVNDKMYYPVFSVAPFPSEDMPEDVKTDYLEARDIVNASPRAAAALLRLSLQKLMIHLGENGNNLNADIANLVKSKGLSPKIQQALDSIRVIGNESVHPGELNLRDDQDTAISLFKILNIIVDAMISQPKLIEETYQKLPHQKVEQINNRDTK